MLKIHNLTIARGPQRLLHNSELHVFMGERIALIGENGAGKSSLLATIYGQLTPESGSIDLPSSWRIAYVSQETPALSETAQQFVLAGDEQLLALETAIEHAIEHQSTLLAELYAQKQDIDGYAAASRVGALLLGLGFSVNDLNQPVANFSGGWRMRLNLARALASRADLLLLDEPTNHLDIEAVIWLEQWLLSSGKTLIIVSHDREFLDAVATHTVSLANQQLCRYSGGYSNYEKQKNEQDWQNQLKAAKQNAELEKLQSFVDRFRAKASKATQAKSRLKRIEKMQAIAQFKQASNLDFGFLQPDRLPDPLVTLVKADCGYNESTTILKQVTLEIRSGDRIGLLGQNGNGKSTLIKSLVGELPLLCGQRIQGHGLKVGYFAQHQVDYLDPEQTVLNHLRKCQPHQNEQELRSWLGRYGFAGDTVKQDIGTLSGGEKARLTLACIIADKPNLLLLDEPTNHLDIQARDSLCEALLNFSGALLLVSHDRHLLEAASDCYYRVVHGELKLFEGDLNDYSKQLNQERLLALQNLKKDNSNLKNHLCINSNNDKKLPSNQRQQLTSEKKSALKKIQNLENQIDQLNTKINQIDLNLNQITAYKNQPLDEIYNLSKQRKQLEEALLTKEDEWLELLNTVEKIKTTLINFEN